MRTTQHIPPEERTPGSSGYGVDRLPFHAISRVASDRSNGAFALRECSLPPYYRGYQSSGYVASTHLLYVLDGTLALTLGDETMTAVRGGVFVIPPGMWHQWWNPTAQPVNLLYLCSPGTCEETCRAWLTTLDAPM